VREFLPERWVETTLGQVHLDFSQSVNPTKAADEVFELYSVPSFPRGEPEVITGRQIGSSKQSVIADTVLLCGINPRLNRVWVVEPRTANRLIASTEWIPFFPQVGIVPNYLAYFLRQHEVRDFLARQAYGVGGSLMRVKALTLAEFPFPLAPKQEQDRIVAEIEKQLTRVDAAVAALKRVQANLKRYRASVLKAACEGRLVPTEAELARKEGRSYETGEQLLSRVLKERRAKWEANQLAKMKASGKPHNNDEWKKRYKEPEAPNTSSVSTLPSGWVWVSLDQVICSGPQNGLYKPISAYGSGTPILRIDDYQVDSCRPREELRLLQTSEEDDVLYALTPGDIVLNRVNSPSHLGKSMVVAASLCPCVFESNMMRFRTSDLIDPEWLTTVLQTGEGKARLTANAKWAVNQASINQEDVKQTLLPLPPLAEQTQILGAIRQQLSINSKIGEGLTTTALHAERLRQSILKRAFEGKLVRQDANDEPASELLERIRAGRNEHQGRQRQRKMTVAVVE
jgi:type I restriction enzyme S subunit